MNNLQSIPAHHSNFNHNDTISKSFIQNYHHRCLYHQKIPLNTNNILNQIPKKLIIQPPSGTKNIDLNVNVTIYTENTKNKTQNPKYIPNVKFTYLNNQINTFQNHIQSNSSNYQRDMYMSAIKKLEDEQLMSGKKHELIDKKQKLERMSKISYSIQMEEVIQRQNNQNDNKNDINKNRSLKTLDIKEQINRNLKYVNSEIINCDYEAGQENKNIKIELNNKQTNNIKLESTNNAIRKQELITQSTNKKQERSNKSMQKSIQFYQLDFKASKTQQKQQISSRFSHSLLFSYQSHKKIVQVPVHIAKVWNAL